MGRETCAAQADNAAIPDQLLQFGRFGAVVFLGGLDIEPGVVSVRLQHDARRFADGRMRDRIIADIRYFPGRAGMDGDADITAGAGDDLAFQHPVADLYGRLRRLADMLLQGQEHPLRQRVQDGHFLVGNFLVRLQQQPAREIM